jgi:hypothetical protein
MVTVPTAVMAVVVATVITTVKTALPANLPTGGATRAPGARSVANRRPALKIRIPTFHFFPVEIWLQTYSG